ncbi:MAG: alpha/beta hydrolase fold domain-containing protein [Terriglobia bacterium]
MRLSSACARVGIVLLLFASVLSSYQQSSKRHHGFREVPPFHLPTGVKAEQNLIYAQYGKRVLHLDLYHPADGKGPFPGVVFIHGGGWVGGPLIQFRRQAAYMASRGFVAETIEYRLAPEAPYPAAIYDCKAAVRWMRANAKQFKIDPHKIAAAGGSAGGHLAAMLGVTDGIRSFEGHGGNPTFSSRVQAVVSFNGIYDFVSIVERSSGGAPIDRMAERFLGGPLQQIPEVYVAASPISHVCKDSAPFLLLHGTADTTSPYRQALEMQQALESVGVRADLFTAKGANHGFFNRPPYYQPALERTVQFLHSVFVE